MNQTDVPSNQQTEETSKGTTTETNNEDLEEAIRRQVEYYFSPQNLQGDHYLVSKMNAQMYVPLEVVANFKLLKQLTNDLQLIIKTLKPSTKVQLLEDGDKFLVRPIFTAAQRTTLILRDLPKEATEDDIKALFPNNSHITGLHPDLGSTYFVTFDSEEETQKAFEATQDKTILGAPVKARIKSENLSKSFVPPPGAARTSQTGEQQHQHQHQHQHVQSNQALMAQMTHPQMGYNMHGYYPIPGQHQTYMPGGGYYQHVDANKYNNNRGGGGNRGRGRGGRGRGGNDGYRGGGNGGHHEKQQTLPTLGLQDFPPLPTTSGVSGYSKDFQRYKQPDIIETLSKLGTPPFPADGDAACALVSSNPIATLELTKPNPGDGRSYSDIANSNVTK